MRLFVVSSVYQFLNALTVQLNDGEPSDLLCVSRVLDDAFDWEKLREEGIFQNVHVWTGEIERFRMVSRSKKEHYLNTLKKVCLALGKRKLRREIPCPRKLYDEISFAYPDYPSRLAVQTLSRKDTRVTHLEDGTYTYEAFSQKPSALKKLAFRLLVGADAMDLVDRIYVYRPEMLHLPEGKKAEVVRIRSELERIGPVIKRIYKQELPELATIDKPVIMFDQTLEESVVSQQQSRIANIAADVFGNENFVVKMHPRSLLDPYEAPIQRYRAKCSFEILMSTLDMQSKVLISMLSTACMNPKLMLDVEPAVIFTVKLSGVEQSSLLNEEMLALIERFRAAYRDPTKVFVPETMEEFRAILEKLKGE